MCILTDASCDTNIIILSHCLEALVFFKSTTSDYDYQSPFLYLGKFPSEQRISANAATVIWSYFRLSRTYYLQETMNMDGKMNNRMPLHHPMLLYSKYGVYRERWQRFRLISASLLGIGLHFFTNACYNRTTCRRHPELISM